MATTPRSLPAHVPARLIVLVRRIALFPISRCHKTGKRSDYHYLQVLCGVAHSMSIRSASDDVDGEHGIVALLLFLWVDPGVAQAGRIHRGAALEE